MALFQTKLKPVAPEVSPTSNIAAKIQQRRYQILVHSLLYYELDINLVTDSKWSEWAMELVSLQKANPDIAQTVIFASAFKDFDGSTGFDLPYRDAQIVHIARKLLKASDDLDAKNAIKRLENVGTVKAEYKGFSNSAPPQTTNTQRKVAKKNEPLKRKKLF